MRSIACLLLALGLMAGCAGTQVAQQKSVYALRGTYDAYLDAASAYSSLPLCVAGQPAGMPCAQPNVVLALKKADDAAKLALDSAENIVRNSPVVDPTSAISAAEQAVNAVGQILAAYNIKIGA